MTTTHSTSANVTAAIGPKLRSRLVLVAVIVAGLAACSSGGNDSSDITVRTVVPTTVTSGASTTAPPTTGETTTTTVVAGGFSIAAPTIAAVATESPAGEEGKLDATLQTQLLDTVTKYVQLAITAPLSGSTMPVAVDQFLTAHAVTALTADRRAVLTDEGVPAMQSAQATTDTVTFTGLVGADTQTSVVSAHLDLVITGTASGVPASIKRTGDLTLIPDSGGWRVDAFDMTVERDLP
jgi:hypothetical protein